MSMDVSNGSNYMEDVLMSTEMVLKLITALDDALIRHYGIQASVEHTKVLKTNGEVDALQVRFDNTNISPIIYLDEIYNQYKNGMATEQIAQHMANTIVVAQRQSPVLPNITKEEAQKAIRLVLVNSERNEKLLQKVPHFEVGDLSAIPRWFISDEMSFLVTDGVAGSLLLTGDEVLQMGLRNNNATKFEVASIEEMLWGMKAQDVADYSESEEVSMQKPSMVVMTSKNRIQGASAILSKEALEQVVEKLQSKEFYILPSSIHEVICIPAEGDLVPNDLRTMVREVNATLVSPQEFLSDNIMKYDGHKIELVRDEVKLDTSVPGEKAMYHSGLHM